MDLSALPAAALLRWDLAVRLGLSLLVPMLVALGLAGSVSGSVLVVVLAAALVSFASLGPDLSDARWLTVAAVGVPVAVLLGAWSARLPSGGVLTVFVLFTAHGVMVRAGLLAQVAWFPVATAGLLAAMFASPDADLVATGLAALAGSGWAVLLLVAVPRVVRTPRLDLPAGAVEVDTALLQRMVRHPAWVDWLFPLMLGAVSALLLVSVNLLTGGFKPYWATLALVGVLAPTAADTRRSARETVLATLAGVVLAGLLLALPLSAAGTVSLLALLALIGALVLLRNGGVSKALLTPLPVVAAALALDADQALALGLRVVEYLVGAAAGIAVVVAADRISRRLWTQEAHADEAIAG